MYRERESRLRGAVVWSRIRASGGTERVLPDGCTDLLLWGGQLVIAGPDSRAHLFEARAGESITGVRFAPGAGPSVFGVRACELRDRRVPLAEVWSGAEVRRWEEAAAGADAPGRVLEQAAEERVGRTANSTDAALHAAVVERLEHGSGVAQAARAVGLSERQLYRRCLDVFGYGPKTLARVLRMRRALALAGAGAPFARVAADAGYADQAHLSREVRALAGVPLTRLIRSARPRERP